MTPRIRVLQVVTGLAIGEQVGGAELFGAQLARRLEKEAFRSAVVGLWEYGSATEKEWIHTLESEGIHTELLTVPRNKMVLDLGRAIRRLWTLVHDFRPHIINSHSERTDVFNIWMNALHPARPLSVRTMHTDEQWQDSPFLGAVMISVAFPLLFDAEVAISEAVRRRLDHRILARLIQRRSVLIYNGVDASLLDERARRECGSCLPSRVTRHTPRIGIVGRLTRQKGHRHLISAMNLVVQARCAHLLIIGAGPFEDHLRRLASELGVQDFVHFLGSRRDVLGILPHLDLLVSSSLWEGFPTVLLEAMAMGVPIVATDVSGSRELVHTGKTGILVPSGEPNALAEAILRMLDEPAAAQLMARNARQLVSRFTIQEAASRYAQLYQRLVAGEA
ncbi:MAG: glycosyltransferase [Anaerolineae bacterium]|jgi:glycosyltransferase involved in cell wall biosynthesis